MVFEHLSSIQGDEKEEEIVANIEEQVEESGFDDDDEFGDVMDETPEAPAEVTPEAPVEESPEAPVPVEEAPVEETPEPAAPVEETPEPAAPVEEPAEPEVPAPVEETPEPAAPVEEAPVDEATDAPVVESGKFFKKDAKCCKCSNGEVGFSYSGKCGNCKNAGGSVELKNAASGCRKGDECKVSCKISSHICAVKCKALYIYS